MELDPSNNHDNKNNIDGNNQRLKVVDINRLGAQTLEIIAIDANNSSKHSAQSHPTTNETVKVIVEGVWSQSHISKTSIIHLVNPNFDKADKVYYINNSNGFLITEPDSLLTCTLVASSLFCERKTWLNHVFLGQVGTNRAMLVGTLVHEVFQYGVRNRIADLDKLTKFLDELLDDATIMLEIYSVEKHLNEIRDEAITYIPSVKEWIDKYMFSGPRYPLTNDTDLEVKVIGVQDIEENIWSTKYGLKGKIDVTGSVRVYNKKTKALQDKIIPLELKTGNPNLSPSHAAQVSLYSMMIEDRYAETNQGFVIYLKEKAAMHDITLTHNIKRDLIQRRNQINYHMKSYFLGPDMIDQSRMCKNCERLTECVLMSELYTPSKLDQFPTMKSLEGDAIGHLDNAFKQFFMKYHEKLVRLMVKSSSDSTVGTGVESLNASTSFWTYTSAVAESRGTGFGKLQATYPDDKKDSSYIVFRRHPKSLENFMESKLSDKKPPVKRQRIEDYFKPVKRTSDDIESVKQMRPFDTELNFSRCRIAISLDEDDKDMESQNSSTAIAIGFMNELKENQFTIKLYEGALDQLKPDVMYRVDKLEKRANIDIERTVLVRLLTREDPRCDRVRELLLNPDFIPKDNVKLNLFVLSTAFEEICELSDKQQKFVVEAISTDNYYTLTESIEPNRVKINKIVSVMTHIVSVKLERTMLIVAQNIDNLVDLMKYLQNKKVKFILIDDGKSTKARFQFASNLVKVPQIESLDLKRKYEAYIRQHEMAPVVITTYAMSVGGLLFTRRRFDYCVIYDCDKTELLLGLSPMFCSDRFVILDVRDESSERHKMANEDDVTLGEHLRSVRRRTEEKLPEDLFE